MDISVPLKDVDTRDRSVSHPTRCELFDI